MQTIAFSRVVFSLTLAALLFFGILYALLVRYMSERKVQGQTAYMVVGGVTIALVASIPSIGLYPITILFAYFSACGLPMVIEYALRVHEERRSDEEAAAMIAIQTTMTDDEQQT